MKLTVLLLMFFSSIAFANQDALTKGREVISKMQGCYLVDYSYVETEALKQGYVLDRRVYDVNKNKAMKEWIYMEDISPTHVRLQHILFGVSLDGKVMEGSELRHQAEDWQFNAPYLYEFISPAHWEVRDLKLSPNMWTRRITSLDDGLRYQCMSDWNFTNESPEWSCANLAPIPGREFRDMKRKDYNVLDRITRIMIYRGSWLERQDNTKIVFNAENQTKTPLAKETGKNWYVRLPDSECKAAQDFVQPRQAFWTILRETWSEVLDGKSSFREKIVTDGTSRYLEILNLEEDYLEQDLSDAKTRAKARTDILKSIQKFRE